MSPSVSVHDAFSIRNARRVTSESVSGSFSRNDAAVNDGKPDTE